MTTTDALPVRLRGRPRVSPAQRGALFAEMHVQAGDSPLEARRRYLHSLGAAMTDAQLDAHLNLELIAQGHKLGKARRSAIGKALNDWDAYFAQLDAEGR